MKRIIGIIGGEGKMGRWLNAFFSGIGCSVLSADRKTALTPDDLARRCDVLVLSVPIDAAVQMARSIGPLLCSSQLLTDVCSLKHEIVAAMRKSTLAEVVGMHPLFGPGLESVKGQNVVLCPVKSSDGFLWLKNVFETQGAMVTVTDPETHDRMMGIVQGLSHWITITIAETVQKSVGSPNQLERFATPVFRLQLGLIGRLLHQDPALYEMLIARNPYVKEMVEAFQRTGADVLKDFIDFEEGCQRLGRLKKFFGELLDPVTQRTDQFLDRSPVDDKGHEQRSRSLEEAIRT
ncbi:prephenate dehydrogenase/arogenate dehydrogenase family protein [Desulfatirhabdium butyrativorans]|uniref:prephenate dehydrogenase/arogenate dehydrogenase family protein n=1 Tax=Desulfatirhabdium butyrativorans TaxID=340467 RepID=UPI000417AA70|nr:prephenate dehydrogenase/arogenate dehydrogenase family protein [Desulfatirhabdium butyrativorans]